MLRTVVFILKAAAGGRDEEEAEGLIQQVPGMDFEAHPKPKCSTYIHRAKHHESVATYHWLSGLLPFALILGPSWAEIVFWEPGLTLGRTRKTDR